MDIMGTWVFFESWVEIISILNFLLYIHILTEEAGLDTVEGV
jgi:hypothetical protein